MPLSPGEPEILAQTLMKPRQSNKMTASIDDYVIVTPVKKRILENGQAISTGRAAKSNDTGHTDENEGRARMTIFERLGWMDDDDD
jgi:hypothetical protein